MPNQSKTYLGKAFGLEQNSLIQSPNTAYADDCLNVQLRKDTGLEKRKGFQTKIDNNGGYGLVEYSYINSDNTVTTEKLVIDESLYKIEEGTFSIAYTGSQPHASIRILNTSGELKLQLIENAVTVLDQALGKGYEEASIETLAATKTAVDAITGFAVTITGDTTVSSAFLDVTPLINVSSGKSLDIKFLYLTEVNKTITSPLDNLSSIKGTTNLKNVKAINHNNLLILTDGGFPKIYDGQTVYKAGLPKPTIISITSSVGSLSDDYVYYMTYEFTDARGKRTESAISDAVSITLATQQANLTIPTLEKTSGYNTNCAVANGTQSVASSSGTVTLTVNDGIAGPHTLKAGDTALLHNRATGVDTVKTYDVQSVTATTIVLVSDETIDVTDKDPISNNLKINIYREDGVSTTKTLVYEIPNNSFVASLSITDNDTDTTDNAVFTEYLKTQAAPPKADFCASYKGNLVLAKGQTIYFSDEVNNGFITSSLSFPSSHFLLFKDVVTAIETSIDTLLVFGEKSIHGVEGRTLDTDIVNKFLITNHIGCASADSIVSVGKILYFLTDTGVYAASGNTLLSTDIGIPSPISKFITNTIRSLDSQLNIKRAVGVNDIKNNRVLMFIPSEITANTDFSDTGSITLVHDYENNQWFIWKNVNMAGGAILDSNKDLYWSERKAGATQSIRTHRSLDLRTTDDYWDHTTAISSFYEFKWDSLDTQSLTTYKKPLNLKLYSIRRTDEDLLHNPTLTITTYKDYIPSLLHSATDFTLSTKGENYPHRWNQKPFGNWREGYTKTRFNSDVIESLKIKVENNTGGVNFNLSGLEIEWADPYDNQLKT